jgi:hypothetical protein
MQRSEALSLHVFPGTGLTLTAVATLALGIASNTAIFSVINTIAKPFANRDSERIVMFQNVLPLGRFDKRITHGI